MLEGRPDLRKLRGLVVGKDSLSTLPFELTRSRLEGLEGLEGVGGSKKDAGRRFFFRVVGMLLGWSSSMSVRPVKEGRKMLRLFRRRMLDMVSVGSK